MTLRFKYGFTFKTLKYGWHEKKLYRLPCTSYNRTFVLKEVPVIRIGNKDGYCCVKVKKTIDQLKEITKPIKEVVIEITESVDVP